MSITQLSKVLKDYIDGKDYNKNWERTLANKMNCFFVDEETSWGNITSIVNTEHDEDLFLIFKAGNYNLSSIKLKSNTHVIMSEGAIFTTPGTLFLNFNNDDTNGDYTGNGNITLEGGTVNGQLCLFTQAENIEIKNVNMQNATKSYIVFSAIKNAEIRNCKFNGILTSTASTPCVLLTANSLDGFSYSSYSFRDGNSCKNIKVTKNEFKSNGDYKNYVCLGSTVNHYTENTETDKNIYFTENLVYDVESWVVGCSYWENVFVSENYIENTVVTGAQRAVFLWRTISKNVHVYNNTCKNINTLFGSNNISFTNKRVKLYVNNVELSSETFTQVIYLDLPILDNETYTVKSTAALNAIRNNLGINILSDFAVTTEVINDVTYNVYSKNTAITTTEATQIKICYEGQPNGVGSETYHNNVFVHDNYCENVKSLLISAKRIDFIKIYNNKVDGANDLLFKAWYTKRFVIADNEFKNVITTRRFFFASYAGFECDVRNNLIDNYIRADVNYLYWYVTRMSSVDNFVNATAYLKNSKDNLLINGTGKRNELSYNEELYIVGEKFRLSTTQISTATEITVDIDLSQLNKLTLVCGFTANFLNTVDIKPYDNFFVAGHKFAFTTCYYDVSDTERASPIYGIGSVEVLEIVKNTNYEEDEENEDIEVIEVVNNAYTRLLITPSPNMPVRRIIAEKEENFINY